MNTKFDISYNSIESELLVQHNGKAVSIYSQFARCNGQPFWIWYKQLSQYCFSEANGSYSVNFTGGVILEMLLRKELTVSNGCKSFSSSQELITGIHRMRCANELLGYSQIKSDELKLDISCETGIENVLSYGNIFTKAGNTYHHSEFSSLPLILRIKSQVNNSSDILMSTKIDDKSAFWNGNSSKPKLFVWCREGEIEFQEEQDNCFVIGCSRNEIAKLVLSWISEIIFPKYVKYLVALFRNYHSWNCADKADIQMKIKMLTSNTPFFDLTIPSRIELNSMGKIQFKKYPEDLPCKIFTSDPNIAVLKNGIEKEIKPLKEGQVEIIAQVKGHSELRVSKPVIVYKFIYVQSISLTPSATSLIVGEKLSVQCSYSPRNAHNISHGQWDIIPNKSLKPVSTDTFVAVAAGRCELIRRVDGAKASVIISVFEKSTSVRFDNNSLSVKMGDYSQKLNALVYPIGSIGGTIKYSVSNPAVLDFDVNNGQIIPKAEGISVVTATLIDNKGVKIDDCNCCITVLPPKDIVTPDIGLVLLILSLVGSILLINTDINFLCGLSGTLGAILYSIRTNTKMAYILSAILLCLIIVIIILGGFLK